MAAINGEIELNGFVIEPNLSFTAFHTCVRLVRYLLYKSSLTVLKASVDRVKYFKRKFAF
jgi:hypothetical protein